MSITARARPADAALPAHYSLDNLHSGSHLPATSHLDKQHLPFWLFSARCLQVGPPTLAAQGVPVQKAACRPLADSPLFQERRRMFPTQAPAATAAATPAATLAAIAKPQALWPSQPRSMSRGAMHRATSRDVAALRTQGPAATEKIEGLWRSQRRSEPCAVAHRARLRDAAMLGPLATVGHGNARGGDCSGNRENLRFSAFSAPGRVARGTRRATSRDDAGLGPLAIVGHGGDRGGDRENQAFWHGRH